MLAVNGLLKKTKVDDMCYFIIIGIDPEGRKSLRKHLPREIQIIPSHNPHVSDSFPEGTVTFLLVDGWIESKCSCNLYRKSKEQKEEKDEQFIHTLRKGYQKRGWSENKIQQAVKNKLSSLKKKKNETFTGLTPLLCSNLSMFANEVGSFSLLVHYYNDSTEVEQFKIKKVGSIQIEQFIKSANSFPEDTLIRVQA